MDPLVGAALIGGAGNLIGGILGQKASLKDRQHQETMWQRQTDVEAWRYQQESAWREHAFNTQRGDQYWSQTQAARENMRHLIDEGKAQGLHPLSVIGQGSPGYTPVGGGGSLSTQSAPPPNIQGGQNPMGDAVSRMGDKMARLIDEKYGYESKKRKLDLERDREEIELLRQQRSSVEAEIERGYRQNPNADDAALPQTKRENGVPENDPLNPRNYYHSSGPYAGHYVIPLGDGQYAIDAKKFAPVEVYEALTGDIGGEVAGVIQTLGAKKIKRPGGPKGPKFKGKPGQQVKIGDDVWVWSRASNSWKKRKKIGA